MSDTVAVALITGGITGLVGIAGLAFSFWNSHAERQQRLAERKQDYHEWYRRTLFEKRLNTAQEAYAWWRRLNEAVAGASGNDDPNTRENQAVRELATQASEWYYNSSFWLEDAEARVSMFVDLTNTALQWARGRRDLDIHRSLNELYQFVRNFARDLLASEKGRRLGGDEK
jgi:hypothetical protein